MSFEWLFPGLALLLVGLGWPLARRRIGPNHWYGLRVPATFADTQVWYEANALAGRDLMALGATAFLVWLGLYLAGFDSRLRTFACALLLGLGSLLLTVRGWRAANRLLRARRAGRERSHTSTRGIE